jgi:hypothetical protein
MCTTSLNDVPRVRGASSTLGVTRRKTNITKRFSKYMRPMMPKASLVLS